MDKELIGVVAFFCPLGVMIIFGVTAVYEAGAAVDDFVEVVIEGSVTNIDISDDVLYITFDNNETYDVISYQQTLDFTVNSKLIVILQKSTYDGLLVDPAEHWHISKIIKVPD